MTKQTDTENTTATDAPEANVAPAEPDNAEVETTETDDDSRNPNREAAKYRTQLRDTQKQLEETGAQLHTAQLELLAAAADRLRVLNSQQLRPEAFADALTDTEGLFAPDGKLDRAALQARLNSVQADKPYLFKTNYEGTFIIPAEGKAPDLHKSVESFEAAFTPKDR